MDRWIAVPQFCRRLDAHSKPAPNVSKTYDVCLQKILEIQESRKIADAEGLSVIQTGLEGGVKRIVGFLGQTKQHRAILLVYVSSNLKQVYATKADG